MVYIVFEGIVGSGKSTQAKRLVEHLKFVIANGAFAECDNPAITDKDSLLFARLIRASQGEKPQVVYVREPGSTPIAEDIRLLAQKKEWENESMHPITNAYLFAAARAQTLHTIVKPALESGNIVISDRSFISSCAIQGEAQGLGINTILWINKSALGKIFPDIVFYLDIDIDTALSRTFDASGDKFESESRQFYEAIVRGYEKCEKWNKLKNRFIRIDASGNEDEIFERICSYIPNL